MQMSEGTLPNGLGKCLEPDVPRLGNHKKECRTMKRIVVFLILAFTTPAFSCDAITKRGTRCKRASAPGSNYCWQHGGGRASSSYLSGGATIHSPDTPLTNGGASENVLPTPRHKLVVKSFLGIPIGALAKKIQGTTIKGNTTAKLVKIRPFRNFSKAAVNFTGDGERVYEITSEYMFSPKVSKESVFKEADAILKIFESKCGVKFRKIDGSSGYYPVGGALGSIGGYIGGGGFQWDYEHYESRFIHIRLTCKRGKVANKTLLGPNTPRELDTWKMVLSFRALNTHEANWHDLFIDGIALP